MGVTTSSSARAAPSIPHARATKAVRAILFLSDEVREKTGEGSELALCLENVVAVVKKRMFFGADKREWVVEGADVFLRRKNKKKCFGRGRSLMQENCREICVTSIVSETVTFSHFFFAGSISPVGRSVVRGTCGTCQVPPTVPDRYNV